MTDLVKEFRKLFKLENSVYYDGSSLNNTEADYKWVLGARANGKSFYWKNFLIFWAFKTGNYFAYLRRFDVETRAIAVEEYFSDAKVSVITNKKYDRLTVWRSELYLTDDSKNIKEGTKVGRVLCIAHAPKYKSQAFEKYYRMLAEEITTEGVYLDDELTKFMSLVSTVFRGREGTEVIGIGNKITRFSPYFREFSLVNAIKQEEGTIDIYNVEGVISAVEMSAPRIGQKKMFTGRFHENIVKGKWESKVMPRLPHDYKKYEKIYSLILLRDDLSYVLEFLIAGEELSELEYMPLLYVHPYTKNGKQVDIDLALTDLRVITRNPFTEIPSPSVSRSFDTDRFRIEKKIVKLIEEHRVAFSDNLTGTEFYSMIDVYY